MPDAGYGFRPVGFLGCGGPEIAGLLGANRLPGGRIPTSANPVPDGAFPGKPSFWAVSRIGSEATSPLVRLNRRVCQSRHDRMPMIAHQDLVAQGVTGWALATWQ